MLRALELAKRGLGSTYPNPAVGCVLVKAGLVVGEGFHPRAGMPHAEVYALRGAGKEAEGSTAYVTLEPCNHHGRELEGHSRSKHLIVLEPSDKSGNLSGRTPPCSQALVDARVVRVVVGVGDPNPLVSSAGIATLEQAGIIVSVMDGEERDACYEINREFMDRMAESNKH